MTWDKLPSFSSAFDSLRFSTPNQSTQKEITIKPTPSSQIEAKKVEPVIDKSHSAIPIQPPPKPQKSKKIETKRNSGFSR